MRRSIGIFPRSDPAEAKEVEFGAQRGRTEGHPRTDATHIMWALVRRARKSPHLRVGRQGRRLSKRQYSKATHTLSFKHLSPRGLQLRIPVWCVWRSFPSRKPTWGGKVCLGLLFVSSISRSCTSLIPAFHFGLYSIAHKSKTQQPLLI